METPECYEKEAQEILPVLVSRFNSHAALLGALEELVKAVKLSNLRQASLGDCIIPELHHALDALALAKGVQP